MVLSLKQKTKDRFWAVATVVSGFIGCLYLLREGDIAAVNTTLSFMWAYWEFFRTVGDYEYDIKGISCQ